MVVKPWERYIVKFQWIEILSTKGTYHIFTHSLERSNHSKFKPYKQADNLQRLQAQQKFKS